jgi:hypothetical protein
VRGSSRFALAAMALFLSQCLPANPALEEKEKAWKQSSDATEERLAKAGLREEVLAADRKTVFESKEEIEKMVGKIKGLTRDEVPVVARRLTLWSWEQLRTRPKLLPADAKLTAEKLVKYSQGLGMIRVKSSPGGARIRVNKYDHPDPTNTIVFEEEGKHRIFLRKPGFAPVEDDVEVKAREVTLFEKELK